MIVIAEPYARYPDTLPESELRPAATRLLQVAEEACRQYFAQRYEQLGITIATRVEIGSTRTWTTIKAVTAALLLYGSLRQTVDYLVKDGDSLSRLILPKVASTLGLPVSRPERHERRLGIPGDLRRLFARVESGEMSAEEATGRALRLLQSSDDTDTARDLPRLTPLLTAEFAEAAARAEQLEAQLTMVAPSLGEGDGAAKKQPDLPQWPEMALPPATPIRRRRGVVASRDPRTGHVRIRSY